MLQRNNLDGQKESLHDSRLSRPWVSEAASSQVCGFAERGHVSANLQKKKLQNTRGKRVKGRRKEKNAIPANPEQAQQRPA